MVKVYIGTSGWVYDWNPDGLEWYVQNTGLNSVELNMSFYRFPYRNMVASWSRRGQRLRWSIKVHRSITHVRRMRETALPILEKFIPLFKPMDVLIDFYLFQLPPSYKCSDEYLGRIERIYYASDLGDRFAVEFRHPSCYTDRVIHWAERHGLTLVSVDSPIATWITSSNRIVYLRLHGRETWYAYDYTRGELEELARQTIRLEPEKIYVFFNNNHWMLRNAQTMMEIYRGLLGAQKISGRMGEEG